jgi:hypothetical protein
MSSDPKRLIDPDSEAPDGLRTLLESARQQGPSDEQRARLQASLLPLFGASMLVDAALKASPSGAPAAAGAGTLALKVVGGVLIAGMLGVGGWLATRSAPEPAPAPHVAATPGQRAAAEPAPEQQATAVEAAPSAALAPPRPRETIAPTVSKSDSQKAVLEEAALLHEARTALGPDPSKALELSRTHQRRFPSGALTQEREVIAIQALSQLGRGDDAKRRAAQFVQRYPNSPHKHKIESLLE